MLLRVSVKLRIPSPLGTQT